MLSGTPIETESGFKWNIGASFAKNINKVIVKTSEISLVFFVISIF